MIMMIIIRRITYIFTYIYIYIYRERERERERENRKREREGKKLQRYISGIKVFNEKFKIA